MTLRECPCAYSSHEDVSRARRNTTFIYAIPANSFVAGTNTLTISSISGSSDLGTWLSASYAFDCIELDN